VAPMNLPCQRRRRSRHPLNDFVGTFLYTGVKGSIDLKIPVVVILR
jgi:hypothetical protein